MYESIVEINFVLFRAVPKQNEKKLNTALLEGPAVRENLNEAKTEEFTSTTKILSLPQFSFLCFHMTTICNK